MKRRDFLKSVSGALAGIPLLGLLRNIQKKKNVPKYIGFTDDACPQDLIDVTIENQRTDQDFIRACFENATDVGSKICVNDIVTFHDCHGTLCWGKVTEIHKRRT